jgi:methylenetetrahydrofolate dehydrogenase (NADP+)/methenyltetrahydrofolate cyclohydrolase
MAKILSGKEVAQHIYEKIENDVENLRQKNIIPKLEIFLIEDNPGAYYYSQSIIKKAHKLGIEAELIAREKDITEEELLALIHNANQDNNVHGILVQLPLPSHLSSEKIIMSIAPDKDIDGLHPLNAGKLIYGKGTFVPSTPSAVIEILKFYNIVTDGRHIAILGRSNIVGKPLIHLLLQKNKFGNATVTICHSHTTNLPEITKTADILIAAIGKPHFVKANMIKEGATVIDVGINEVQTENGKQILGDVDYEDVLPYVSGITPVPGGVGLVTTATLLSHLMLSAGMLTKKFKK